MISRDLDNKIIISSPI